MLLSKYFFSRCARVDRVKNTARVSRYISQVSQFCKDDRSFAIRYTGVNNESHRSIYTDGFLEHTSLNNHNECRDTRKSCREQWTPRRYISTCRDRIKGKSRVSLVNVTLMCNRMHIRVGATVEKYCFSLLLLLISVTRAVLANILSKRR